MKSHIVLRVAGVAALLAVGFYLWSCLDPPPIPVILARIIGQTFATGALAGLTYVVLREARTADRGRESVPPPGLRR